jgi:hypothetical protein
MSDARGFLGAGDLYINRIVAGIAQGWEGPIECSKFEIKANAELKERTSKGRDSYGQIVASAAIPQPFDLNITINQADKTGLSIALLGTAAAVTQTSGTITSEAVTLVKDVWVPLSKANFSTTAFTVTKTAGSVLLVLGTDYIVNWRFGWVKALTATAATACTVSGSYLAQSGTEIKGATAASVRAKFRLDGKNMADDTPAIVNVYEAVVASDAAIDFLSDDFLDVPLPGRMVTPAGFSEPFTVQLLNG